MLLKDLRKAIWEGKLVDITGVKLRTDDIWSTTNQLSSVLHIRFNLPSVENKPINDSLDIPELSLSTKPKYDPCREFKEGDKVRVKREVHGRPVYIGDDAWEPLDPNEIWSVEEDEVETGWVHIKTSCVHATVWHGMLELITPVEELEPYSVVQPENYKCVRIMEGKRIHSSIPFDEDECVCLTLEQAKAAAEAERDRLNANYRKDQNNV